jgi:hypothetical protein
MDGLRYGDDEQLLLVSWLYPKNWLHKVSFPESQNQRMVAGAKKMPWVPETNIGETVRVNPHATNIYIQTDPMQSTKHTWEMCSYSMRRIESSWEILVIQLVIWFEWTKRK